MTWVWIWLGIVALCVIIEAITMELVSCWCIAGGLIALILALCKVSVEIQWLVFGIVSLILLISFRKLALKYLTKNDVKTNTDATFGKTVELLTPIKKNENGTIKINGIIWNATTADKTEISAGENVILVNIEGNKYIVKKETE